MFATPHSEAQNKYKNIKVGPQSDGSILVPSNQLLRPAGFQVSFAGRPVDLALAVDNKLLVVKNMSSLDVIRVYDRTIIQSLAYKRGSNSFTGLSVSADGRKLFVSDSRSMIHIAEFDENLTLHWTSTIKLPSPSVKGSPVPGGLTLSSQEDKMFVTLSRSNTLAVVNLNDTTVTEIPVGIAPYEVVLMSDSKAYVSNGQIIQDFKVNIPEAYFRDYTHMNGVKLYLDTGAKAGQLALDMSGDGTNDYWPVGAIYSTHAYTGNTNTGGANTLYKYTEIRDKRPYYDKWGYQKICITADSRQNPTPDIEPDYFDLQTGVAVDTDADYLSAYSSALSKGDYAGIWTTTKTFNIPSPGDTVTETENAWTNPGGGVVTWDFDFGIDV